MTDNIIKHLANILARLVQIHCEMADSTRITLDDLCDISEAFPALGFDMSDDIMNRIRQRAMGLLALNDITVEL